MLKKDYAIDFILHMRETMKIVNLKDYLQFTEVVTEWVYKEFIENIIPGYTYERVRDKIKSREKDKIPCTFIAIENDECIGTVALFSNDLQEREDLTPWLAALYVRKDYRAMGVAKELINKIEKTAKKFGYNKLYLRTEHASEYYKKLGWISIYQTIDEHNLSTKVFMKKI